MRSALAPECRRPGTLFASLARSTLPSFAGTDMHVGRPPEPHDLWQSWSWEPAVIVGLALAGWLYARGLAALRARTTPPRSHARGLAPWRARCYAAGLAAVAVALVSPVDAMGSALFAAHMVQHLLLVMVAAPLLVLGEPALVTLWALPAGGRRGVARVVRAPAVRAAWRSLRHPLPVWLLHTTALWAWHLPRLYEAALRHPALHALEHASFFVTALLFWWLLADRGARRRLGFGTLALYLFVAMLQSTVLGAFITLARRPWYPSHFATTGPWGLTPLEDQQLAGLIMWVPAGIVYLAAIAYLVVDALRARPSAGAVLAPDLSGHG